MTKTERQARAEAKRHRVRLKELRAYRKGWLSGADVPWGLPRCAGPTSPYHQRPVTPFMPDGTAIVICEGCAGEAYVRAHVAQIDREIKALTAPAVPAQASLF